MNTTATGTTEPAHAPHVDWPAIFAGALLASAIGFVLMTFLSGVGMSIGVDGAGVVTALLGGILTAGVIVASFAAGGYLAGRLRRPARDASEHEVDMRDGAHGLVVWSLGVLVAGFLAASGLTTLAGAGAKAVGEVASAASGMASSAAAGVADSSADPMGYLSDSLFRTETAQPAGTETTTDPRAEAGRILAQAVADGELNAADQTYLAGLIARETKVDQATANQRIEQAIAKAQSTAEEIKQTAADAADTAQAVGVITAFLIASLLIVSAAAAWWAALLGAKHRDEGTEFAHLTRWN